MDSMCSLSKRARVDSNIEEEKREHISTDTNFINLSNSLLAYIFLFCDDFTRCASLRVCHEVCSAIVTHIGNLESEALRILKFQIQNNSTKSELNTDNDSNDSSDSDNEDIGDNGIDINSNKTRTKKKKKKKDEGIHSLFAPMCYNKMLLYCNTHIGSVFFSLLSYSWASHCLMQNELSKQEIFRNECKMYRNISVHSCPSLRNENAWKSRVINLESYFFKSYSNSNNNKNNVLNSNHKEKAINDFETFKKKMDLYFEMNQWHEFVDWNQFMIAGGSILRCLCPFVDKIFHRHHHRHHHHHHHNHHHYQCKKKNTLHNNCAAMQDIDFFAVGCDSIHSFKKNVDAFISKLKTKHSNSRIILMPLQKISKNITDLKDRHNKRLVKVFTYGIQFNSSFSSSLSSFRKIQFIWSNDNYSRWGILNLFDLSCCQVGFDGTKVICTPAFMHSIRTRHAISYKVIESKSRRDSFVPRIRKYMNRGFQLWIPCAFTLVEMIHEYIPKRHNQQARVPSHHHKKSKMSEMDLTFFDPSSSSSSSSSSPSSKLSLSHHRHRLYHLNSDQMNEYKYDFDVDIFEKRHFIGLNGYLSDSLSHTNEESEISVYQFKLECNESEMSDDEQTKAYLKTYDKKRLKSLNRLMQELNLVSCHNCRGLKRELTYNEGFGLNNDSFGIRNQFVQFIQNYTL